MPATNGDKRSQRPLQIGLFGFGVVGTAVYRILQANAAHLTRQSGGDLAVKRVVVRNPAKPRPVQVPAGLITADPLAILNDPEIEIAVEVMGGLSPAREYVLAALQAGKSVVTANKELVSEHSQELLAAAADGGADLFFEASVGGGIPVLRPLRETLAGAGRIHRVMGIVNGTTNYILTQMTQSGKSFFQALGEAQAAGYAEPDPTADVEGHDPARKIAILASLAFHTHLKSSHVETEGITRVAPEDISYGSGRGWALKLLAFAAREGDQAELRVHPAFLPAFHPLAGVHDAFNAIYIHGAEVGETMFYGRGAGGPPTASAVIGDILEAAQHRRLGVSISRPWAYEQVRVRPAGTGLARFYLRLGAGAAGNAAAPALVAGATGTAATPALVPGGTETAAPARGAAVGAPAPALALAPGSLVLALLDAGVPVERTAPLPGDRLAVETGPVAPAALLPAVTRAGARLENAIRILD